MLSDSPSFRQGSRSFAGSDADESFAVTAARLEAGVVTEDGEPAVKGRRILIVQGDWEAGMSLLALDLQDAGHHVGKVFFCAPDVIYQVRGIRTHLFRKPLGEFDAWLRELVGIDEDGWPFTISYAGPPARP